MLSHPNWHPTCSSYAFLCPIHVLNLHCKLWKRKASAESNFLGQQLLDWYSLCNYQGSCMCVLPSFLPPAHPLLYLPPPLPAPSAWAKPIWPAPQTVLQATLYENALAGQRSKNQLGSFKIQAFKRKDVVMAQLLIHSVSFFLTWSHPHSLT